MYALIPTCRSANNAPFQHCCITSRQRLRPMISNNTLPSHSAIPIRQPVSIHSTSLQQFRLPSAAPLRHFTKVPPNHSSSRFRLLDSAILTPSSPTASTLLFPSVLSIRSIHPLSESTADHLPRLFFPLTFLAMGNFFAIPNLYNSNPVFFSSTSSPQQPLQSPPESPVASPTSPASSEPPNTSPPSHPSPLQSSPPPMKSIPYVRVVTNLALNVPSTEYAILDFLPDSNSPENMTYQHLLSDDRTKNSIALYGMGGVGKTTILCALGRKQEIRYKFEDGVFFFRLGHDITMPSFIHQLQGLVKSVLPEFLEDFKEHAVSEDSYNTMIIELINLLTQKRFLLLFDDVCEADASVYRLVRAMCESVQRSERKFLKVLSSTRNRNVANAVAPNSCIPIHPGDSDDSKCLKMFCTKAGISELDIPSLSAENGNALGHIMRTCGGLPLVLSLSGSAVKQLMDTSSNHCDQNAISEFWGRLEPNIGHLARGEVENRHKGLDYVLLNSSQFLEKWESEKETEKLDDEVRAREIFKSFCIMQKQVCLPVSAIEELWDVREVKTGKRFLSRNSLVSEVREGNEIATEIDEIVGVGVHDLVRDMSIKMAKSRGGETKWHARVLDGYRGSLNIIGGTEDGGEGKGVE